MKVFITKYALTEGIQEMEAEDCSKEVENHKDKMIMVKGNASEDKWICDTYYHGNDWHTTREAAVAHAEEMRKKKIVSLQKSIKKLQAMKF